MGDQSMMPLGHIGIPLIPFLFHRDPDWDIRLLILGSLLPDIIDKPLGHLILPHNNGRIIVHSLLLAVILLLSALAYRPLMPLSLGVSMHQILDGTFLYPKNSLWPIFGGFESTDYEIVEWLYAFLKPYVIIEELVGISIIIFAAYRFGLFEITGLKRLARTGRLGPKRTQ
jgi:hypothetical protein